MLISYRWLGRHVDLSGLSPEEVAEDLTLHTAEVEGVEPVFPALADVVVGHVVAREPHPDADRLSRCRVDVGEGEPLPIVCGAPNVAAGQRVAVATVGTTLPGDLRIEKAKIRGVESVGMICSERELGLGEEHDGIWVLPEDAPVGRPVADALDAADWRIEIDNKSLTHRPDLWGHRGIAAELAAIRGLELAALDLSLPASGSGEPVPVRVESPRCARYLAVPIDGVRATRSPDWLRRLLLAAGQRPLDLLVDVSNFVMLDLGQPNHLFDRARLGEGIVVRQARAGERMRTLDGVERTLDPEDLLICSGETPVALAGVMGGEETEVGAETDRLLLEVAAFDPVSVRRTSARHGLRTEASARFEKHLDPTLPAKAAAHLVRLLGELSPGLALPAPPTDAGAWTDPARTVRLRPARARAVLGVDADDARIAELLGRLGFGVEEDGDALAVAVPSARATKDVAIEEDLIEEVGRLWRYDRVPERALTAEVAPVPRDERRELVRAVQDRLALAARYLEAPSYSFVPDALVAALGDRGPWLSVRNPVAEGLAKVRRSVVPSLLAHLEPNLRRRPELRLFEVGKGYRPEERDERGQPAEVHEAGVVLAAPRAGGSAGLDAGALRRLQGDVADLLAAVGRPVARWEPAADHGLAEPWAHPVRALAALAGERDPRPVALVAALDPRLARELGSEVAAADVAAARVSLDAVLDAPARTTPFRPLPRYPALELDVALAVPATTPAAEVARAIEAAGKGLVADLALFDLYEGESVGAGRRSLAWHVVLQAADRTLEDRDEQRFLDRLARGAEALGGELRRE